MQASRLCGFRPIVLLSLVLAAPPVRGIETRVQSESADGMHLVLEVRVPDPVRSLVQIDGVEFTSVDLAGYAPVGPPGSPQLYLGSALLAVPPRGGAGLHVLESSFDDLGVVRLAPRPFPSLDPGPDRGLRVGSPNGGAAANGTGEPMLRQELRYEPQLYATGAQHLEVARLGAPGTLRYQQVVPLEVAPLQYDAQSGRLRLLRRLVVQIDMWPGPSDKSDAGDAAAARLATSPSWDRICGALVNARQARAWQRAPRRTVRAAGPLKSGLLRPGLLGEDEWKLRTNATGPVRVQLSALRAAGFPDATPVPQLRLVLKRYDPANPLAPRILEIPIQVRDGGQAGAFDGDDSFIFYAENARDDPTSEDTRARYGDENVYWLSVASSGTPARMPVRTRLSGTVPGPDEFQQKIRYEEDHVINAWVFSDNAGLYFWKALAVSTRITVPVPGRVPAASLGLCVETQDDRDDGRPFLLYARTGSRDSVLVGQSNGNPRLPQTTCGTVSGSALDPADVTVILRPFDFEGALVPFLDRISLDYRAQYLAVGDRIRCTSGGATGKVEFTIAGFSSPGLLALDITDPKHPAAFDLAGAVTAGTLALTDSLGAGQEHTYLVLPGAAVPALANIEKDHADDILEELAPRGPGGYDGIVVAHDSFFDDPAAFAALTDWRQMREEQGHHLRLVRTSDAYDAFRGGLKHTEAIYRLCQQAFQNWGIAFVTLVGDGSEDPRHLQEDSGFDFVPSRVAYFLVQSSTGSSAEFRNDLNDKHYAQVAGGANDWYPDLLIGRLPVGSAAELRAVVDKTIRYEHPAAGDDSQWRKRVVSFADDEWVKRDQPGVSQLAHGRFGCVERDFEHSVRRTCDIVNGAFPGDLHCVPFYMRLFSDQLFARGVPEHRPVPLDSACVKAPHAGGTVELDFYVREVGDALVDSVGAGALFFALQSHASRSVVTDEFVMSTRQLPYSPDFHNDGKPFVFFGFGCHLNEFGPPGEEGLRVLPGDALGERMVLEPNRGAVASYASTGFEFLNDNNFFHEHMWDVIFNKRYSQELGGRAVSSDTVAARWLLADLLEISEITTPNYFGASEIAARYVLLGDPMLRLDAGVPRFPPIRDIKITNGFLQPNYRLVVRERSQPVEFDLTVKDEQGIDSLWAVQRFTAGGEVPIGSLRVTAIVDTLPQVRAKRAFRVVFSVDVQQCNFDIVIGARDLAGRVSELVARVLFDQRLMANGVAVENDDRVDPRTLFRFEINGCDSIPAPLPLEVFLDGAPFADVVRVPLDSTYVNWKAEFTPPALAAGQHALRFVYAGQELATYALQVGAGFGMWETLAFPNPMRKLDRVTRIYFHLSSPITGGWLRIQDVNGRTLLRRDLRDPGVVKSDLEVPPGSIGSGVGQDDTHWNWVEWDGRDAAGGLVANGVYLYELRIQGRAGEAQRRRDKIVVMR